MNNAHHTISQLCADLGKDPLLVQGAGGNVSWKEGSVLWVKGSGTWLANADKENIFVAVDLPHLQYALSQGIFEIKPQLVTGQKEQKLRPSIETILHALMSQKIVVHLHAINALSHLVTSASKATIKQLLESTNIESIKYAFVDYHKPGPELAQAIQQSLKLNPDTNVIFLKNHGIVVGAQTVEDILKLLQNINAVCAPQIEQIQTVGPPKNVNHSENEHYIPFADAEVQRLAMNPDFLSRLQSDWVLFPDHVVFLGVKAYIYDSWEEFKTFEDVGVSPELIFIKDIGVFVKQDFGLAKTAQLRCYFDVISRVPPDAKLDPLSEEAISALLNWDAEKYRISLSK